MGPTGVGKDVLAEDIHRHSPRAPARIVAVNCAALSTSLLESELFGHVRGAYTSAISHKIGLVELADRGTLFLDEVGELSPEAQAKLLRFLARGTFWPVGATAERSADVRIIAATNRDLPAMIDRGFREDLFYRLSVVTIVVPRLHADDVRVIARALVSEIGARAGIAVDEAAIEEIAASSASRAWRGGVRELRSTIERHFLLRDPGRPVADGFRAALAQRAAEATPRPALQRSLAAHAAPAGDCAGLLDQMDALVFLTLAREAGGVRELARRLDRSQQAVYDRLRRLGVRPRDLGTGDALERSIQAAREALRPYQPWLQAILNGFTET
jgi:transcriptional regulator with GAF, ATPase, and Fis domain